MSFVAHAQSLQSCLTLCDPMDCSLLGSPVHRISQGRVLEWVAISSPQVILPTQGSNLHLPYVFKCFLSEKHLNT